MKKILVVDDDKESCELLKEIFLSQGWGVTTAQTPDKALEFAANERFNLLISDINLEAEKSGMDLLISMRDKCPVILVTGFGSLEKAVEASREGAWDFISKPFKVEEVIATAKRAFESTENENKSSEENLSAEKLTSRLADTGLIGRAPAMINLYKEIARVAPSRSTVLILGESGTGKELVARSIHKHSPRNSNSFIPVNCGALTETLLEAELFGYVKGAFTGANTDRKGLWEEANGGTLFLDEIGETSQAMQVKLLRALQEGEIRRVGATRTTQVDTRIIAATNRNLEEEVKKGSFREDLFYRLSVVTLPVPSLKERRSDIPLLAKSFLARAERNAGKESLRFSEKALKTLIAYDWHGNVRELESAVEYSALQSRGAEIMPEDLPAKMQTPEIKHAASRFTLAALYEDLPSLSELERRYLIHVLEIVENNRTRAAEVLGVDRRTLYRMAERYEIKLDGE